MHVPNPVYWQSSPPDSCQICHTPITDTFLDAKTLEAGWACMCVKCWGTKTARHLGLGYGQRYDRQPDGRWLKTGG